MGLHVGHSGEVLPTHSTGVWPHPGMRPHVDLIISNTRKVFTADMADMGLLASVGADVDLQSLHVGEVLVALATAERTFSSVDAHVCLHVALTCERFVTK